MIQVEEAPPGCTSTWTAELTRNAAWVESHRRIYNLALAQGARAGTAGVRASPPSSTTCRTSMSTWKGSTARSRTGAAYTAGARDLRKRRPARWRWRAGERATPGLGMPGGVFVSLTPRRSRAERPRLGRSVPGERNQSTAAKVAWARAVASAWGCSHGASGASRAYLRRGDVGIGGSVFQNHRALLRRLGDRGARASPICRKWRLGPTSRSASLPRRRDRYPAAAGGGTHRRDRPHARRL